MNYGWKELFFPTLEHGQKTDGFFKTMTTIATVSLLLQYIHGDYLVIDQLL